MAVAIKILDFIRSGKFGPVELGMSKRHIISLLGEGDEGYKGSLFYGCYEFFFSKKSELLTGIQNDHLFDYTDSNTNRALFKNEFFVIKPWIMEKINLSYDCCISALIDEKISFQEKYEFYTSKIICSSGVILTFDDNEPLTPKDELNNKFKKNGDKYILEGIRLYGEDFELN